eukprot:TRINITY_DN2392_c0_g1_i2.p1 TRINITY_DN2392_c0_g1~~TRINITY_DN2392_c0_g1_i2.p1  ORF type:complete len:314 (-),score=45.46 TRINITY_DN2392_c0_g1_i2:480-1421(-)
MGCCSSSSDPETCTVDSVGLVVFKTSEVVRATNDFSTESLVGRGNFDNVYRAQLRVPHHASTVLCAVKKLDGAKNICFDEFLTEVTQLSKLKHKNLVQLIGYGNDDHQTFLVYEFMEGGNLGDRLKKGSAVLSWGERLKILLDVAKGMKYLHEHDCIHRNLKLQNIMLCKDGQSATVAKITGFSLALSLDTTHASTQVKGTIIYLDPLYMETGKLTKGTDVYAFGVLLLEVIMGRAFERQDKGTEVELKLKEIGKEPIDVRSVVDARVQVGDEDYDDGEAMALLQLVTSCTSMDIDSRPTAQQIVGELLCSRE